MGCYVMLRCPLRFPSFDDRYFWQQHYDDDNGEVLEEYRQIQEDDVESKYPGWAAIHAKEIRDQY